MKIFEMKETNIIYAEHQEQYLSLPAHKDEEGLVTCCFKLSFLERLKVLFFGKMYLELLTFNNPLQPIMLHADNPLKEKSDDQ